MRVLFIYRNPKHGFSIGKVFKPIEEELSTLISIDSIYLPAYGYNLRSMIHNIRYVKRYLQNNKIDIIHITGTENYLIPFLKKYKTIVTLHDLGHYYNLKGLRAYIYKFKFIFPLLHSNIIVPISTQALAELRNSLGSDIKAVIIGDAISNQFIFHRKEINFKEPIILHIGTRPHKNLTRTIKALNNINCRLRIIGPISSNDIKELEANGLKYTQKKDLSDEEILEEYIQADIINFPSYHEGFGMPIIEGQAIGRPVVTSSLEPMKTVSGGAASFCVPFEVESIRDAYLNILNNKQKTEELIEQGLKNAEKYRVSEIASAYLSLYNQLLK